MYLSTLRAGGLIRDPPVHHQIYQSSCADRNINNFLSSGVHEGEDIISIKDLNFVAHNEVK